MNQPPVRLALFANRSHSSWRRSRSVLSRWIRRKRPDLHSAKIQQPLFSPTANVEGAAALRRMTIVRPVCVSRNRRRMLGEAPPIAPAKKAARFVLRLPYHWLGAPPCIESTLYSV